MLFSGFAFFVEDRGEDASATDAAGVLADVLDADRPDQDVGPAALHGSVQRVARAATFGVARRL